MGTIRWLGLVTLSFVIVGFTSSTFLMGKPSMQFWSKALQNSDNSLHGSALRSRLDWEKEDLPAFCRKILEYPQPKNENCTKMKKVSGTPRCDVNRAMMFSQYGEDYYLYTRHFSKLDRPGVYLDVAANDAVGISNTYFMDRCLGWKGLCVEANPKYFENLHRERSCALVPTCVSSKDGVTVDFVLTGPGSGIVATHRQGSETIQNKGNAIVRKRCTTMELQAKRYGITSVDYLNLDVEGHELDVLKSFDWDSILIKVISVEITPTSQDQIEEFLVSKGFQKHDNERPTNGQPGMPIYPSNEFYLHSSVEFGRPE